jgi:hypothetical protein
MKLEALRIKFNSRECYNGGAINELCNSMDEKQVELEQKLK